MVEVVGAEDEVGVVGADILTVTKMKTTTRAVAGVGVVTPLV